MKTGVQQALTEQRLVARALALQTRRAQRTLLRQTLQDFAEKVEPLFRTFPADEHQSHRWSAADARNNGTLTALVPLVARATAEVVTRHRQITVDTRRRAYLAAGVTVLGPGNERGTPKLARLREAEWDPTEHPRQPAGNPEGGEFAPAGGGGAMSDLQPSALFHGTNVGSEIRAKGFRVPSGLGKRPWISTTTDRQWAGAHGEEIIVIDPTNMRIMSAVQVRTYPKLNIDVVKQRGVGGAVPDQWEFAEWVTDRGYDAFQELNNEAEIAIVNPLAIRFARTIPTSKTTEVRRPTLGAEAQRQVARAVIFDESGQVWLLETTDERGEHLVMLPGGGIEPGEPAETAAIRETFEETGLAVAITDWLVDIADAHTHQRYYRARLLGGTPATHDRDGNRPVRVWAESPGTALRQLSSHYDRAALAQAMTQPTTD